MLIRESIGVGPYGSEMRFEMPPGDDGNRCTIGAMTAILHHAAGSELVEKAAAAIRATVEPLDHVMQLPEALFWWLKSRFKFKRDPAGVEAVRTVEQMLIEIEANGKAFGDCDEVAVLAAAILAEWKFKPVFVLMNRPGRETFEHVYAGFRMADRFVPFDPQETDEPFTERAYARREIFNT